MYLFKKHVIVSLRRYRNVNLRDLGARVVYDANRAFVCERNNVIINLVNNYLPLSFLQRIVYLVTVESRFMSRHFTRYRVFVLRLC